MARLGRRIGENRGLDGLLRTNLTKALLPCWVRGTDIALSRGLFVMVVNTSQSRSILFGGRM